MTQDARPTAKPSPILTVKMIAEQLGRARQSGDGWMCTCPNHKDETASLWIAPAKVGEKPIYVQCHRGCNYTEVEDRIKELGLYPKDLPRRELRNPKPYLTTVYDYLHPNGLYAFSKGRYVEHETRKKDMRMGRVDEKGAFVPCKVDWVEPDQWPLYRGELLSARADERVFIVEGEKDVDTLQANGLLAVTTYNGAAGEWLSHYSQQLSGRRVVVLPDNDKAGLEFAQRIVQALEGVAEEVGVVQLPGLPEKGDVSDWLGRLGSLEQLLELVAEASAEVDIDWRQRLLMNDAKHPKPLAIEANGEIAMRYHPRLRGLFGFDTFRQKVVLLRDPPFDTTVTVGDQITDTFRTALGTFLQAEGVPGSIKTLTTALELVADTYAFDSLRVRVDGLTWDGVKRLDTWLVDYCHAEGPAGYLQAVGAGFFIGGAARAYANLQHPAKVDQVMILEDKQGGKKSTLAKTLCLDPRWFQDRLPSDLGQDNAIRQIQGKQVVELAELTALKKTDNTVIKEFLSREIDSFIPKYKEMEALAPRRCVFFGTHNPDADGYLTDPTGARRILPVEVNGVDIEGIKGVVEQLWAEGKVRYLAGEKWWVESEDAVAAQKDRFRLSPIAEEIMRYITHEPLGHVDDLDTRRWVVDNWALRDEPLSVFFPTNFWSDRYNKDWSEVRREVQLAVSNTMTHMGWKKRQLRNDREGGLRRWGYSSPEWKPKGNPSEHENGCHRSTSKTPGTADKDPAVQSSNCLAEHASVTENIQDSAATCDSSKTAKDIKNTTTYNGVLDVLDNLDKTLEASKHEDLNANVSPIKVLEGSSKTGDFPPTARHPALLPPHRWAELEAFIRNADGPIALDLETTSLHPRDGRVRLVQLSRNGQDFILDLNEWGDLEELALILNQGSYVVFNAAFEMTWFRSAGIKPVSIDDAKLAVSAIRGGSCSLAQACKEYLDIELDKSQQVSDWANPELSQEQLDYAIKDAQVTMQLWQALVPLIAQHDVEQGYQLLLDAVPAIIDMQDNGVKFDLDNHAKLVERMQRGYDLANRALARYVPEVANWNSPKQVAGWLRNVLPIKARQRWPRTNSKELATNKDALREVMGKEWFPSELCRPLSAYLVRQRYGQYLKTFGNGLAKLAKQGRIHGSFNISQAITGRMSSSSPNLQNMPNGNGFRGLFIAPEGKRLVCADYSQIEVRVGGLLADEPVIADAFAKGYDFHQATAAKMNHKAYEDVTKAERKSAKAVTFGMQYGMGTKALAKSLNVTEVEATNLVKQWEQSYPKVAAWRHQQADQGTRTQQLRTAGGRRIALPKHPSPSTCYNYPVQGSAGDVMYAALSELHKRLQAIPSAKMLLVVHDEVLVECDESDVEAVCRIVEEGMKAGFLKVFEHGDCTGLVDAAAGSTWAEAK